jgi:hypothetical protein
MYVADVTNRQVIVYRLAQVASVTSIYPKRQNVNDNTAHQTRLSADIAMFTTDTDDDVAKTTAGGNGQSQLRLYVCVYVHARGGGMCVRADDTDPLPVCTCVDFGNAAFQQVIHALYGR